VKNVLKCGEQNDYFHMLHQEAPPTLDLSQLPPKFPFSSVTCLVAAEGLTMDPFVKELTLKFNVY
jgi:hypothetical protein